MFSLRRKVRKAVKNEESSGGLNRREFSAMLAGSLLAGGSAAQAATGMQSEGSAKPDRTKKPKNILLMMSDQHRPASLSINGNTPARTPNLDALARSGVRFDHAYSTCPVCAPSRASLLTGLWMHNHGVMFNESAWPYEHKTIAHHLGRAGYITSLIGKMHFVDAQTHGFDYHLDFNDWMQYLGPKTNIFADEIGNRPSSGSGLPQIDDLWRESGDPWTGNVVDDGRLGLLAPGGVSKLEEQDHFESFVTRESIRFLKHYAKREEPFFLISSYLKPHDPFFPAQRFYLQFEADQMKMPDTWGKVNMATVPKSIRESIENPWIEPELDKSTENAKKHMALYYASLMQMDDNVGQMLKALKDLGLEDDTIVLYVSDHGEMLGEHGLWQKTVFYEESVGVPFIMRAPGVTTENTRSATPVSLVSVVPTLLDLCGVDIPVGLDGESLTPDLHTPQQTRETVVYSEYGLHSKYAKAMLRAGDFKYMTYAHDAPDQMFNLREDPEEMNNLAIQPAFAAKAAEMKTKLDTWHAPG
jgi:choline-sulfatase